MDPLSASHDATNKPAEPAHAAAAPAELPLLLSLPDVSWPPPRHADRLPRVALENVAVTPATPEPTLAPASRVQKALISSDRIRVAGVADLPWHERPAVREWIAKLASGGIIALVVLTLAGMFTRPWRSPAKNTAVSAPAESDLKLQGPTEEPIIRQAQREPPIKIETKPRENPARLEAAVKVETPAKAKAERPKLPQLTAPPTISPEMPVRLPAIDEPELNAPQNSAPANDPSSTSNRSPGGISDKSPRRDDVEYTARLRGIIEPQSSRLR